MQEVCASSGAGERRHELLTNQPRLSDSSDNDAAFGVADKSYSVAEAGIQIVRQSAKRFRFLTNDSSCFSQLVDISKGNDRAR